MNRNDYQTLLPQLVRIAAAAGQRILQLYGAAGAMKEDGSPVTAADYASQELIQRELRAITPDVPILSEETTEVPFESRKGWNRLWLVDPLDGTKEFIKQSGEFTVNIALVENGEAVLGVVHAPALETSWTGERGGEARVIRGSDAETIRVLSTAETPVRLVVSRDHLGPEEKTLIDTLAPVSMVSAGSALKFCLVAEGRADLYPRFVPTMEWDTAAAQAVLEAAGGHVTDTAGNSIRYNRQNLVNPPLLAWADRSLFEKVRIGE